MFKLHASRTETYFPPMCFIIWDNSSVATLILIRNSHFRQRANDNYKEEVKGLLVVF